MDKGRKFIFILLLCGALALRLLCPGLTAALGSAFHRLGGGQGVYTVGQLLEEESRVFFR